MVAIKFILSSLGKENEAHTPTHLCIKLQGFCLLKGDIKVTLEIYNPMW